MWVRNRMLLRYMDGVYHYWSILNWSILLLWVYGRVSRNISIIETIVFLHLECDTFVPMQVELVCNTHLYFVEKL